MTYGEEYLKIEQPENIVEDEVEQENQITDSVELYNYNH